MNHSDLSSLTYLHVMSSILIQRCHKYTSIVLRMYISRLDHTYVLRALLQVKI